MPLYISGPSRGENFNVRERALMAKLDIKEAYRNIPVAPKIATYSALPGSTTYLWIRYYLLV